MKPRKSDPGRGGSSSKFREFARSNMWKIMSMSLSVSSIFVCSTPRAASQDAMPMVTLNRVVASVGGIPVTQREVELERKLETFLSTGKTPSAPPSSTAMESAQSRLINQKLLEQALAQYRFDPNAIDRDAAGRMTALRKKFKDEAAFQSALRALGMTEPQLLAKLKEQSEILQMIDEQLRPSATVSAQDIENYYQKTLVPSYAGKGSPPALKDVRGEIREILTQKDINQLLDQWLAELKKDHPVELLGQ
ncbi:MAG TPA: SurA N-terminal domain-containing protein [Terriglobia bacterium]|nr:SurA N-terminal domain-containing protein [Terriglobia bacterium]